MVAREVILVLFVSDLVFSFFEINWLSFHDRSYRWVWIYKIGLFLFCGQKYSRHHRPWSTRLYSYAIFMFLLQLMKPRCLVYWFVICIYQKKGKYREGVFFVFFGKYACYKHCVYWAGISCSVFVKHFLVKIQLKDLLKTHPCWIREQWESPVNMPSSSLPTVFSLSIHGKGVVFVLYLDRLCFTISFPAYYALSVRARCWLLFLPFPQGNPVCQHKTTLWLLLLYQRSILLTSRVLPFHFLYHVPLGYWSLSLSLGLLL